MKLATIKNLNFDNDFDEFGNEEIKKEHNTPLIGEESHRLLKPKGKKSSKLQCSGSQHSNCSDGRNIRKSLSCISDGGRTSITKNMDTNCLNPFKKLNTLHTINNMKHLHSNLTFNQNVSLPPLPSSGNKSNLNTNKSHHQNQIKDQSAQQQSKKDKNIQIKRREDEKASPHFLHNPNLELRKQASGEQDHVDKNEGLSENSDFEESDGLNKLSDLKQIRKSIEGLYINKAVCGSGCKYSVEKKGEERRDNKLDLYFEVEFEKGIRIKEEEENDKESEVYVEIKECNKRKDEGKGNDIIDDDSGMNEGESLNGKEREKGCVEITQNKDIIVCNLNTPSAVKQPSSNQSFQRLPPPEPTLPINPHIIINNNTTNAFPPNQSNPYLSNSQNTSSTHHPSHNAQLIAQSKKRYAFHFSFII